MVISFENLHGLVNLVEINHLDMFFGTADGLLISLSALGVLWHPFKDDSVWLYLASWVCRSESWVLGVF